MYEYFQTLGRVPDTIYIYPVTSQHQARLQTEILQEAQLFASPLSQHMLEEIDPVVEVSNDTRVLKSWESKDFRRVSR